MRPLSKAHFEGTSTTRGRGQQFVVWVERQLLALNFVSRITY